MNFSKKKLLKIKMKLCIYCFEKGKRKSFFLKQDSWRHFLIIIIIQKKNIMYTNNPHITGSTFV